MYNYQVLEQVLVFGIKAFWYTKISEIPSANITYKFFFYHKITFVNVRTPPTNSKAKNPLSNTGSYPWKYVFYI